MMSKWLTTTATLLASILLAEYRLRGSQPSLSLWRLAVVGAVGSVSLSALAAFWPEGAFPAALLAGQAVYLVWELLRHRPWLAAACLCLGFDITFLPLCLCGENVWQYAIYLAALALCAVLGALENRERFELTGLERRQYILVSCIPCAVLLPGLILLAGIAVAGDRLTVITGLLTCGGFLFFYFLVLLLQEELAHRLVLEALNSAMSRWQRDSRDYMNVIRSQRHDLNLHLNAISGLLRSGSYEKCQAYVNKMVAEVNAINDIMPVGDAVVGSMLLNMREEARRRGSNITYHITYDMRDTLCNGFECNKIIGNLLQNAIDALETPEDKARGISLRIFKRRGNTVIAVENRFTGDKDSIARMFETGYSTKKNHEGIGLSMVLRTVQRYGGRVYPVFNEDSIRIVVNIPNKIRLAEKEGDTGEYPDIDP